MFKKVLSVIAVSAVAFGVFAAMGDGCPMGGGGTGCQSQVKDAVAASCQNNTGAMATCQDKMQTMTAEQCLAQKQAAALQCTQNPEQVKACAATMDKEMLKKCDQAKEAAKTQLQVRDGSCVK